MRPTAAWFPLLLAAAVCWCCPTGEDPVSKALRSPVVFHGKLLSTSEEGLKVTAVFRIQKVLKSATRMVRRDTVSVEFWRNASKCAVLVRDLIRDQRYIVFAAPNQRRTTLRAVAPVSEFIRKSCRLIRKAVCQGCAKPATVRGFGDSQVEARKRLRLRCKISGNPPPHVDWYRNGTKLRAKGRVKIRTKRKLSRLEINQVRPQDSGVYECRASNAVSKHYVSAKSKVTVVERADIRPQQPTNDSTLWPLKGRPCLITSFCLNGGVCSYYETVGEYVCQCAEGYRGQRCESKDIYTLGILEGKYPYPLLLSAVIVLAVLLFLTCSAVGCYTICRIFPPSSRRNGEESADTTTGTDYIGLTPLTQRRSPWAASESTTPQTTRFQLWAAVDPTPKRRQRLLATSSEDALRSESLAVVEPLSEVSKYQEIPDDTNEIARLVQAAFRSHQA